MGLFRDLINEARNTSVPTEYRIALGQLKRMYNAGEVPSEKELQKDAEMIAKKNHLEEDKFFEFAKSQFKINESEKMVTTPVQEMLSEATKSDNEKLIFQIENQSLLYDDYKYAKNENDFKLRILKHKEYLSGKWVKKGDEVNLDNINWKIVYNNIEMNEAKSLNVGDTVNLDVYSIENSEYVNQFPGKNVPKSVKIISPKINVNGDFTFEVPKYKGKEAILPKKFILESAVGTPGRTTVKDAEEHINDELLAEFKKIIKKLGGKTVAKVLLDKLGQKAEIKDEIDHIEDIIDNSNY